MILNVAENNEDGCKTEDVIYNIEFIGDVDINNIQPSISTENKVNERVLTLSIIS